MITVDQKVQTARRVDPNSQFGSSELFSTANDDDDKVLLLLKETRLVILY